MGARYYDGITGKAYPISDVTNGTLEPSENLLNFSEIDGNFAASQIIGLKGCASEYLKRCDGLYQEIVSLLSSLESERLYSGAEAQTQIGKLEEAIISLQNLSNRIEEFDEESVKNICKWYNEKIKTYSNDMKMYLLKRRADRIDNEAMNGTGKIHPKHPVDTRTYSYRSGEALQIEYKPNGEGQYPNTFARTKEIKRWEEGEIEYKTFEIKFYKYINYWKWFKLNGWPFDIGDIKDVNKFEEIYFEIEEELPYKK